MRPKRSQGAWPEEPSKPQREFTNITAAPFFLSGLQKTAEKTCFLKEGRGRGKENKGKKEKKEGMKDRRIRDKKRGRESFPGPTAGH